MVGFEDKYDCPVPAVVTVERPDGGPPTEAVEVEPAEVCPAAGGVYKRANRAARRLMVGLLVSEGVPNPARSRVAAIVNVLAAGERAERAVTGERSEYEVAFNEPRPDLDRELETIGDAEGWAEGWADRLPAPRAEEKPRRTFTRDADGLPLRHSPCEADYRLAEVARAALALHEALEDYERDDPAGACGCPFCEYKAYLTGYLGAAGYFVWDVARAAEGDAFGTLANQARKLATGDTDRRRIAAILREHARETAATE